MLYQWQKLISLLLTMFLAMKKVIWTLLQHLQHMIMLGNLLLIHLSDNYNFRFGHGDLMNKEWFKKKEKSFHRICALERNLVSKAPIASSCRITKKVNLNSILTRKSLGKSSFLDPCKYLSIIDLSLQNYKVTRYALRLKHKLGWFHWIE